MIPELKGREILALLERHVWITVHITIGTRNLQKYVSRTSVVFVSISFIVLMIISLAWLVFYYIQRFRYANARDRNQVWLHARAVKVLPFIFPICFSARQLAERWRGEPVNRQPVLLPGPLSPQIHALSFFLEWISRLEHVLMTLHHPACYDGSQRHDNRCLHSPFELG